MMKVIFPSAFLYIIYNKVNYNILITLIQKRK